MAGKFILLLLIYATVSAADFRRLRKLGRRELTVYAAVLLISLYLGISYVFELKWPFLGEAADVLIGAWARAIFDYLKTPS